MATNSDQMTGDLRIVTGSSAGALKLQTLDSTGEWNDVNGVKSLVLVADNVGNPPTVARVDITSINMVSQARLDAVAAADGPSSTSGGASNSTVSGGASGSKPSSGTGSSSPSGGASTVSGGGS